jgi:protein O-mannosyl-transferase
MRKFFIRYGIFIFFVVFLLYSNTLNDFFISDDYTPLGFVKDRGVVDIIKENLPTKGGIFIRPVHDLFFKLDYSIWHFNPLGFHLTNILFQALNSILVAVLAYLLIKNKLVSILAGVLFAIHPLHPDDVVWLSGRANLIATFFYLIALVAFIKYHDTSKKRYLYIISVIAYPVAILSKEIAITLPVILFIWQAISTYRPKFKLHIPFWIITFAYLFLRFIFMGDIGGYRDSSGRPLFLDFNFISFIKKFAYNIPLNLILPMNQEVISSHIRFSFMFLFFMGIAMALYLNWRQINKRVLVFCLFFIVINLAIVHYMLGVGADLQGGRLLYLSSAGFCILFAHVLLGNNTKKIFIRTRVIIATLVCLVYVFCLIQNIGPWHAAGKITGQIPKLVKEYSRKFPGKIKFYFMIPDTIKGAFPYGHYLVQGIAPLFRPLKAEDVIVLSDINYGETVDYFVYDFDLRKADLRLNLGKQAFFFKLDEARGVLEDISLSIKPRLDNPSLRIILPKTYYFIDSAPIIKKINIPVVEIGAIELKMRIKYEKTIEDSAEIFWLSNRDKEWNAKKRIIFPVQVDGEFHIYHIPFRLFNPDWLGETYLDELKLQFNANYILELDSITLLPYEF